MPGRRLLDISQGDAELNQEQESELADYQSQVSGSTGAESAPKTDSESLASVCLLMLLSGALQGRFEAEAQVGVAAPKIAPRILCQTKT